MNKKQILTAPTIADEQALNEFANELVDRVDDIERDIAQLNKGSEKRAYIDNIFRELHNIKGDAAICRVPLAGFIAHPLESVLARVRSGEVKFSKTLVEVILLSLVRMEAAVKAMVDRKPISQFNLLLLVECLESMSQATKDDIESSAVQLINSVTGIQPQTYSQSSGKTSALQTSENISKNNKLLNLNLTSEEIDQVFKNIDIPTCPAIVSMAMAEAQREEPDIRKLVAAIEKDVGITALIIQLANSPLFRTNHPASRVTEALARLGTRNVVCVIAAAALRSSMTGIDVKWLEKFWRQASLVATAAGLIAKKQYGIAPDAAYTFALFHDSAIPLLRKRYDNYIDVMNIAMRENISLIDAELKFFPCTHAIAGSLLVRNWGLPNIIGQTIRFHHEKDLYHLPEVILPGAAVSLIAVTQLAERLLAHPTENVNFEVSDNHYQHALAHLGISEEELDEIREQLADQESMV
jgi:HD-like signal output (HDOD) protein/HPt (histidine-containing phosphotransfer) domain-containing protein